MLKTEALIEQFRKAIDSKKTQPKTAANLLKTAEKFKIILAQESVSDMIVEQIEAIMNQWSDGELSPKDALFEITRALASPLTSTERSPAMTDVDELEPDEDYDFEDAETIVPSFDTVVAKFETKLGLKKNS